MRPLDLVGFVWSLRAIPFGHRHHPMERAARLRRGVRTDVDRSKT